MSGNAAILNFGGSFADHHHVGHGPGLFAATLRSTLGSSRTQAPSEFTTEFAASLHVERLIDGFVAHAHRSVIGVVQTKPIGDFLGRPQLF